MADPEEITLPAILKVVNLAEQGEAQNGEAPKRKQRYQKRGSPYHTYTPEQKAMIGKYAAEHGNTKAAEHFTKELGIRIAESTVRLHKKAYYALLSEGKNPDDVTAIPSGRKGRPRRVGGVIKLEGSSLDNDLNTESGGSSSAMVCTLICTTSYQLCMLVCVHVLVNNLICVSIMNFCAVASIINDSVSPHLIWVHSSSCGYLILLPKVVIKYV